MKKRKKRTFFPRLLLLVAVGTSGVALWPQIHHLLGLRDISHNPQDSPVLKLASLSAPERANRLAEIVTHGSNSLEINRAKYVLASDLIQQDQGSKALKYLDNLEKDYPLLAPYILFKRALAHELVGDKAAVEKTLTQLAARYSNSPVVVEALERLGKQDEKFWEQALHKFPNYPRTLTVIQNMMDRRPRDVDLMFTYLRSGGTRTLKGVEIADKLSTDYLPMLKPEDWRLLADAYLLNGLLDRAAVSLSRSPQTAATLFLQGQNARISQKIPAAKTTYLTLVEKYSDSAEADKALLELAEMSINNAEAIAYLDKLSQKENSPSAPVALARKAKLLAKNPLAVQKIEAEIMQRYPQSETAAGIRWEQARTQAARKNYAKAWELAKTIVSDSPDTRYGARAAFWIGKWAKAMGREDDAQKAFVYTMVKYTQSYYSWRAAHYLGWNVGDFQTLRSFQPTLTKSPVNWPLPIGSDVLKELYQIGVYKDAWSLWQQEFPDRNQYSVTEQFTEGLLLKGLGRYQLALAKVSQLEKRETPAEQEQHQIVRQHPSYWQALYPLAYIDYIQSSARKRQINPLLVISIVRQESKFDPETKSTVGALGLMQVMPTTAQYVAEKIDLASYELIYPADNIKLGTWYLAHMHDQVDNNTLLAIAGYNAGPGNVSKWLKEIGLNDPDEFVENIPFDETQGYVRNVLGNYWNYLRTYNAEINQKMTTFLADYRIQ